MCTGNWNAVELQLEGVAHHAFYFCHVITAAQLLNLTMLLEPHARGAVLLVRGHHRGTLGLHLRLFCASGFS